MSIRAASGLGLTVLLVLLLPSPAGGQRQQDGIARLLGMLQEVLVSGQPERYLELQSEHADARLGRAFAAAMIVPDITRAVVQERDRVPLAGTLPGDGYSLVLEVFAESGNRGWLGTWRLDVQRSGAAAEDVWKISGQELLSTFSGLHRLSLDVARQFEARDLIVRSEDLELRLPRGAVFVAEVSSGPTALVLIGDGKMIFRPRPQTERGQLRVFAGRETLEADFKAAFIRVNPASFERHVDRKSLVARPVNEDDVRRAAEVFEAYVGRSYTLNLTDLSPDRWSLLPPPDDFLADVETKRFRTLTYARSRGEAEDVTLFDRRRRRYIALYPSEQKLAEIGRSYDEDALSDYDVLHHDIDVRFTPDRSWIDGRATMTVEVKAPALTSLTLRLSESLRVRSVVGEGFGRLLALPVRNQNSVVVNLPGALTSGTIFRLAVSYEGQLEPQSIDREAISVDQDFPVTDVEVIPLESSWLYSNRSYWHPQGEVTDFATARISVTVPSGYSVVASGEPVSIDPAPAGAGGGRPANTFSFASGLPARYLTFLVSRFVDVESTTIRPVETGNGSHDPESVKPGVANEPVLGLLVKANPRQQRSSRAIGRRATDIMHFYSSLIGRWPYTSLTVAVIEKELPGGHSPAYMTALSEPFPGSRLNWRRDPSSFDDYPDFFLAHELAHQWWGQAIGWKNYHEQWLSEGLAQYFAALYAKESRGPDVFAGIIRKMYDSAVDKSHEGPISLGYRVGHIKGDSRVFRSVVYNKSAVVLHMLRRLVGDEAFFGGLRQFFETWRFKKAGTEDLRKALEETTGRSLERFFERWVYETEVPGVKFSSRIEQGASGQELVVRFEQQGTAIFEFPVTVSIEHEDRTTRDVVVPVTDRVVEQRIELSGKLRRVRANEDKAALIRIR